MDLPLTSAEIPVWHPTVLYPNICDDKHQSNITLPVVGVRTKAKHRDMDLTLLTAKSSEPESEIIFFVLLCHPFDFY